MRHTRTKKFLALLLAVILIAGVLPLGAGAYSSGIAGSTNIVSAGDYHFAVVDMKGDLWVWGSNSYGQLGIGQNTNIPEKPVKIMSEVSSVSVGANHSMAVKKDGTLWAWGWSNFGQLGNGTFGTGTDAYLSKPTKIMSDVSAVSAGLRTTAILKKDGSLWMCGANWNGELGNGGTGNFTYKGAKYQTTPVKIMDNVTSVCVSGIGCIAAAIKKDGSLWTWGSGSGGRLGTGSEADSDVPVKIMDNVSSVSVGGSTMAAVKTDGSLWGWGYNASGLIDINADGTILSPQKIMDNVSSVSVGSWHMATVKKDGTLWTSGSNSEYQLGIGNNEKKSAPVQVMENVSVASAGQMQTIAIKTDGSVWICGKNGSGQLGLGNKQDQSTFQKMSGLTVSTGSTPVTPPKPTVAGFKDVYEDDYYADAVKWAVENNITAGTDKTHFSPSKPCTRAQAVTFLWRAAGEPEPAGTGEGFSDVKSNAYYEKAVQWAVEQGITSGTGNGKFSPNATCTRAQIVAFLYRAQGSPEIAGNSSFSDVSAGTYYENAVKWAVDNNITSGTGGNKFSPDNNCIRGQIVTFLYRYSK